MRLATSAVVVALLAACGGSSGSSTLSGTIHGTAFKPTDVAFIGPDSKSCTTTGTTPISYGISTLLLGFAAKPGVCALAQDPCAARADYTFVAGFVARAQVLSTTTPPLQTGTYNVLSDFAQAQPDGSGQIRGAAFTVEQTNATCTPASDAPIATGKVALDAISTTEVRGSIDVTFKDSTGATVGSLKGPFTAKPCTAAIDACSASTPTCTGTPSCSP